jgi:hypothetical protein
MWLWDLQLHELGFRRRSERYWQCERRYGLPESGHLSVFSWSEQSLPLRGRRSRFLVELTEFHVTFLTAVDNLHFYYHERQPNEWEPGGHTSVREILRLRCDPRELRADADAVAGALAEALAGSLLPRRR